MEAVLHFLIKHAIPVIPDGGAIILTASVAGAGGGLGGGTVYGATKAALRSLGRTVAKELTPRGIRVNTISPGPIVTPILDKGGHTAAQKDAFIAGASRSCRWRSSCAATWRAPPAPRS
jgi:NAD(P)-dependent dehydrogenase (short-subunit alcohol dehydrogenase family)